MNPDTDAQACAMMLDLMIDWNDPDAAAYAAANAGTGIPELKCVLVRWRSHNLLAGGPLRSTAAMIYAGAYAMLRLTIGSDSKAPEHHSTMPLLVHKAAAELGDAGRTRVRQLIDDSWDALCEDTDSAGPQ